MRHFVCKLRSCAEPVAIRATEVVFTESECIFYCDGEAVRTLPLADLEQAPVLFEQSIPDLTWEQFIADSRLEDGWIGVHGEN